jgi:hypothetical protein
MPPPHDGETFAEVRRRTGQDHLANVAFCSSVEITGACAPTTDAGPKPALVLRFTHVDGTQLPAVVLVLDEPDIRRLILAVQCEGMQAVARTANFRTLS